jgi:hypothetical protein
MSTIQAITTQSGEGATPETTDGVQITTGMVVYAVTSTFNNAGGRIETKCYAEPQRTNRSNEPRVKGWLGETNNIDHHADGAFRVKSWRPRYHQTVKDFQGKPMFLGYTVFLIPTE